jgi:hypothetical protein
MAKFFFGLILSFFVSTSTAQDDPTGFGAEPAKCVYHACEDGYQPVPKLPLNFTSSGCNSIGGISAFRMDANGRVEPGIACCHMRAACYQICGMEKSKCDDFFKKCNESICDAIENKELREKCTTSTSMHNMLAGMMGCGPYEHQQHNNCGCMEESKAPAWNKKVIHEFYARFAREHLHKAENLGSKAKTTSDTSNLLLKLIQKYPKSIKKIADPSRDPKEMDMNTMEVLDFENDEF